MSKAPGKQGRGNSAQATNALIAALSLLPGATQDELTAHTGLAKNTVSYGLRRIAKPDLGSWPRRWYLNTDKVIPNEGMTAAGAENRTIPVELGWRHWARACMTWPNAISRLSQSTDPREITMSLQALARNAAALSIVFAAVQDEPDWLERIGGGEQ